MGKKSQSTPKAPDYTKLAEMTAEGNLKNLDAQTLANRPNQNTPWGTSAWTKDPTTGQWTQDVTLSGDQQGALDDQMAIQSGKSDLALGMMGQVGDATSQPFDWDSMQSWSTAANPERVNAGYLEATGDRGRQRIEDAAFARMAPEHQRTQAALETQLAARGMQRGSAAWNNEMQRMQDQQARERWNALEYGGNEQSRQFGMEQQAGQQNFMQQLQAAAQNFGQGMQSAGFNNNLRGAQTQEQMQRRSMPLNELNALLTGAQVGNPQFGGFSQAGNVAGADYMGAGQSQYNASLDAYNAAQAQSQGAMSGLSSLAGAGMMAF